MTAMNRARRTFLWAFSFAPLFLWSARAGAQVHQQPPPGWPRLPDTIPENPGPKKMPRTEQRAVLNEKQKKLRKDVERLFQLASELRDEVARTDATEVLSLAMIDKAEKIEKLAKQIKVLARG
jgi:hypothetical protein